MRPESEVRARLRDMDGKLRSTVAKVYKAQGQASVSVTEIAAVSLEASVLDAAVQELDWVLGSPIFRGGGVESESKVLDPDSPSTRCKGEPSSNGSAVLGVGVHDEKVNV